MKLDENRTLICIRKHFLLIFSSEIYNFIWLDESLKFSKSTSKSTLKNHNSVQCKLVCTGAIIEKSWFPIFEAY